MTGYKLFRLMGVLSKQELNEVEKFLQSPCFNTSEESTLLFRQLCKYHPGMEHPQLTKERLFAKVYGKAAFDDAKMRKLMTRLTSLLERFLRISELEENEEASSSMLILSLEKRSDYGLYKAAVEDRVKQLEHQPERGREYFWEMYKLYRSLHLHPETGKFTVEHDYLQQYIHHLECFFTMATLQNGTEGIIKERLSHWKGKLHYLEAADHLALNLDDGKIPVIHFFHQLHRLYSNPNIIIDLNQLKTLFYNCFDLLDFEEKRFALKLLVNYAIPASNNGSIEYSRFIFDMYRIMIEKNMMAPDESTVNTELFINVVNIGLIVGELSWTKAFIEQYNELLSEIDQFFAVQYCMANWYFYNGSLHGDLGEFEKSIQAINLIPVRSSEKFELMTRTLQLKVKFEIFKKNSDTLDSVLSIAKNFRRHIVTNHTYSEVIKTNFINFIKHYTVLARLTNEPNQTLLMVEKAIQDLEAETYCVLRRWLNEKLKELLDGSSSY